MKYPEILNGPSVCLNCTITRCEDRSEAVVECTDQKGN